MSFNLDIQSDRSAATSLALKKLNEKLWSTEAQRYKSTVALSISKLRDKEPTLNIKLPNNTLGTRLQDFKSKIEGICVTSGAIFILNISAEETTYVIQLKGNIEKFLKAIGCVPSALGAEASKKGIAGAAASQPMAIHQPKPVPAPTSVVSQPKTTPAESVKVTKPVTPAVVDETPKAKKGNKVREPLTRSELMSIGSEFFHAAGVNAKPNTAAASSQPKVVHPPKPEPAPTPAVPQPKDTPEKPLVGTKPAAKQSVGIPVESPSAPIAAPKAGTYGTFATPQPKAGPSDARVETISDIDQKYLQASRVIDSISSKIPGFDAYGNVQFSFADAPKGFAAIKTVISKYTEDTKKGVTYDAVDSCLAELKKAFAGIDKRGPSRGFGLFQVRVRTEATDRIYSEIRLLANQAYDAIHPPMPGVATKSYIPAAR